MIEIVHCHWNKEKYNFGKLNLKRLWVLVTIYQKNTWLFVLVTIYPKIKRKAKHKSTYPKELSSEARLWNGKVLGTHSAPDRVWSFRLLWKIYPFCMMWMICCIFDTHLTNTNSNKFILWMHPLLFRKKIQICFCELKKKINLIHKKKPDLFLCR